MNNMTMTIKVEAPELAAAINKLAAALLDGDALTRIYADHMLKNQHDAPSLSIGASAPIAPPAAQPSATAVPVAPPAPTAAAPAVPVAGDPVSAPATAPAAGQAPIHAAVPTAAAPSFTVEQVGKAGADLIAANPAKMGELMTLLGQFGVQAINQLKPEQLGPFATVLRGLGGKL